MADAEMQALQLDREQATTAADFFLSYAEYAEGHSRDAADPTRGLLDAASALRTAGQWAMLFDRPRATGLLVRSAHIWHRLGYAFGTFLLTALTPAEVPRADLNARIRQLVRLHSPEAVRPKADPSGEDERSAALLSYPQQQAYLALAAATNPIDLDLPRQRLLDICNAPLHRQGVSPIGSLGTPIQVYWDIARNLLSRDDEHTARVVAEHLGNMARVYGQNVRLAMANGWLWSNAAAPVDAVDVDIMGIARAAAHRVGTELLDRELRSRTEELPQIARVAIDIAVLSIGDIDGREDRDRSDRGNRDRDDRGDPFDGRDRDDWEDPFGR
jgi:hypothetical protein